MSLFLPDGFDSSNTPTGASEFSPGSQQTTQEDVALMQRVLNAAAANPLMIPPDLMSYILDYIQTSRLSIPIGQVFGFSQFTAQFDLVGTTAESTASGSYVDLATVGPTLDGLPDGRYILLYGALMDISIDTGTAYMSPSVNGVTPSNDDAVETSSTSFTSLMTVRPKDLRAGGSNSVVMQYAATNTGRYVSRWILALRFAN